VVGGALAHVHPADPDAAARLPFPGPERRDLAAVPDRAEDPLAENSAVRDSIDAAGHERADARENVLAAGHDVLRAEGTDQRVVAAGRDGDDTQALLAGQLGEIDADGNLLPR
jgi:hypothetical protein